MSKIHLKYDSGTTLTNNLIPKYTTSGDIVNSIITDNGTQITVNGNAQVDGFVNTNTSGEQLKLSDTSATGNPYLSFNQTTTRRAFIQFQNTEFLKIATDNNAHDIGFYVGNNPFADLIVKGTTKNVGIGLGATAPSEKLHVNGNARVDGVIVQNTSVNGANNIFDYNTHVRNYLTVGGEFIGGSIPATGNGSIVLNTDTGNTTNIVWSDEATRTLNGFLGRAANTGDSLATTTAGDFFWRLDGSANLLFGTASTERMRITNAGVIGVNRQLRIGGQFNADAPGSGAGSLSLDTTGTNRGRIIWSEGATLNGILGRSEVAGGGVNDAALGDFFWRTENKTIFFNTGTGTGTSLLTLLSNNGNVGIGQTSPQQKLHVGGNARVDGLVAINTTPLANTPLNIVGNVVRLTSDGSGTNNAQVDIIQGEATTGGQAILKINNNRASNDSYIHFANAGTNLYTMGLDGSNGNFYIGTSSIGTNVRFAINSVGNIGLGTGANGTDRLLVNGNARVDGHINLLGSKWIHRDGHTANIFIGVNSGTGAVVGTIDNVGIGINTLNGMTTADSNTAVGSYALSNPTTGGSNAALGSFAGILTENGFQNTYVGSQSGYNNISGARNVFLGFQAGYNETGNDKLYIANSTSTPLIGGDFATDRVGINIDVSSISETFHVNGNAQFDGYISMSGNRFLHTTQDGVEDVASNNILLGRFTPTGLLSGGSNGTSNIAIGTLSMASMVSGFNNIAIGSGALDTAVDTRDNVSVGHNALGVLNPATQTSSLGTVAFGNVALGALVDGGANTAIGQNAGILVTGGQGNTFIGFNAGAKTSGSYNHSVAIGREARVTESNQMVIGAQSSGANINKVIWGSGIDAGGINPGWHGHYLTSISAGFTDVIPDYWWRWYGSAGTGTGEGSGFQWYVAPAGTTGSTVNPHVEVMRITGAGNVGIGTTIPSEKLHVNGNTRVDGFTFINRASQSGASSLSVNGGGSTRSTQSAWLNNGSGSFAWICYDDFSVWNRGSLSIGGSQQPNNNSGIYINTTDFINGVNVQISNTTADAYGGIFNATSSNANDNIGILAQATNSGAGDAFALKTSGKVNMASLPTSSAGLSAGDLWNNSGVLNIV